MAATDRDWLLSHLTAQARTLATFAERAQHTPAEPTHLLRARDEVFTIRETLDTLGVPLATVANDEWGRALRPPP